MQTYSDRKLTYEASTCSHPSCSSVIQILNHLNYFRGIPFFSRTHSQCTLWYTFSISIKTIWSLYTSLHFSIKCLTKQVDQSISQFIFVILVFIVYLQSMIFLGERERERDQSRSEKIFGLMCFSINAHCQ